MKCRDAVISLVACAATVASAIVPAHAAVAVPARARAASAIDWHACSLPVNATRKAAGECGYLSVPLDHADPHGPKIQLYVTMIKHTAKKYQGVMLVNPGGPGDPGSSMSTLGNAVPDNAGATYDWVGFDPRGVGQSKPALHCDTGYFGYDRPNYIPTRPALTGAWLRRSKAYAQACGRNGGALLNHMTTVDTAEDMESIRQALGQRQISYYGFSYGTYLGQVYSTLFPDRVRRMVLDSNVDPRNVWYEANLQQDVAFDRNIGLWFAWLAKYNAVYHLGATANAVRSRYYQELTGLAGHPATAKSEPGKAIGPDEWTDIFLQAAYYRFGWEQMAQAFSAWVNHRDARGLIALYSSNDTAANENTFAGYNAVQCTDVAWPSSWSRWESDNWRVYHQAPFETWDNAWFNAPCLYWPAKPHTPVTVNGARTRSALLIDETLDAATPFEGSRYIRSIYPHASLIAEPGGATHADSLSGDACVDDAVARYLASGVLPARRAGQPWDLTCKPLPDPVPSDARSAAPGARLTAR